MSKSLTFISIMLLFGIFGPPLGSLLVISALNIYTGEPIFHSILVGDDFKRPLIFIALFSYVFGLIPALASGFYVARSAVIKEVFYWRKGFFISFIVTLAVIAILDAGSLLFGIMGCCCAAFSFYLMTLLSRRLLRHTSFPLLMHRSST
ncbi:MAG: hypothetical protein K2X09_01925 [Rickettsiales bacterium]|nr:hypothetical protein [Rickettsiales bacterium]